MHDAIFHNLQLDGLSKDELPSQHLKTALGPYLFEAGLDPDKLVTDRQLLIEGLMRYHVIDERHMELDDIAKGTSCC